MAGSGKGPHGRSASPQAAQVLGVGLQFAAAIVLFLLLGQWLDEKLGTSPWLLLLGVMTGAGAGFYSLWRQLVVGPRDRARREEKE